MPDGDGFRLTEGSAILRYLAEKVGSPAYPSDLRERARVNGTMDWLNANLHRDMGFNFVYPLLFPHHGRRSERRHRICGISEYSKWNIPTEHL
jgi:glutathione S-transferase